MLDIESVTFVITSSNRFDLLERTLDSFFKLNTYPVVKFILHEDSGNRECLQKIVAKYGDRFHVIAAPKREGLSKAIDNCLRLVETEYVFTCEDDWLFESNPNFMSDALCVMKAVPDIKQVWIRHPADHSHPLLPAIRIGNVPIQKVTKGYQGKWNGFSFNPALRRMSDYRRMFPNGFQEFGDEIICAQHTETFHNGYLAYSLVNSVVKHIGWNRHTTGFKV